MLVASTVGSRPCSTPWSAVLSPASFSLSLFLFTGLVTTPSTERPLKADRSPSSESSAASTGPYKGTKGTASGPGPGSPRAGIAGASGAVFASVSSLFVSILAHLARTVLSALGVRHGVAAGTQRLSALCYQKCLKEFFQLFVAPLLLLAAGVGFLLLVYDEENFLLLKYKHPRITQCQR